MTTKKTNPMDKRRELEVEMATIDLNRAAAIKEIFERPELLKAREELEAIYDPSPLAAQTGAATNINALAKSAITLLRETPNHAAGHIASMQAVIDGPPEPVDPALALRGQPLATPAG